MIISVASFKGGVGKTTSAIHLAAYFQKFAPTLLLDGDSNRSSLRWAAPGRLTMRVVDERQAARYVPQYQNIVVDTAARPHEEDLQALVGGCDLLVLPCTPDKMSLDAISDTLCALRRIGATSYRVLLTIIPPMPNHDGRDAREALEEAGIPLFKGSIRRLVAFQRANLEGVTVDRIDRINLGWEDYERIGVEIQQLGKGIAIVA